MNRRDLIRLMGLAGALAATPDPVRRYFLIGQPELRLTERRNIVLLNRKDAVGADEDDVRSKLISFAATQGYHRPTGYPMFARPQSGELAGRITGVVMGFYRR